MQHRRPREGDSVPDSSVKSLRSLRSCSSAGSSERPDLIISGGTVRPVTLKDVEAPDSPDIVNSFLKPAFQSPHTSPTTEFVVKETPSTVPQPCPTLQSPLHDTSASEDRLAAFRTPCGSDVALPASQPEIASFIQDFPAPAMTHSTHSFLHIIDEPIHSDAPAEDASLSLQSFVLDASPAPFLNDDPAGQEVQEVIARPESPLQVFCTPQEHSTILQTPARGISMPFRPAHSPIGKLPQYSPRIGASTTPTPVKDRGVCVPCQCPKPLPEMSLQRYRQKYPDGKYKVNGPGNGSVPDQCLFFEHAVHNGLPLEFVKLSLDLDSSQDRKQRVEDHEKMKTFQGGIRKKGGLTKAGSETPDTKVDVQLASTYHPQYCLQLNNFLPRMHDLRNNFGSFVELYRHICPKMYSRSGGMDEAIPRLLLLANLQDSWAIALLVRFTTSRNPRSGVQTDRCFMDLASQDFDLRSGNHIMGQAIKFGATFHGYPLPTGCFTNRTLPQLCDPFFHFIIFCA